MWDSVYTSETRKIVWKRQKIISTSFQVLWYISFAANILQLKSYHLCNSSTACLDWYSGDLNSYGDLFTSWMVCYSDAWYHESLVFRSLFGKQTSIQMPGTMLVWYSSLKSANVSELLQIMLNFSYVSKALQITAKRRNFCRANLRTLVNIRIYTLVANCYQSSPMLGVHYSDPHCTRFSFTKNFTRWRFS